MKACFISAVVATLATLVAAQGSIDNSSEQKRLTGLAQTLPDGDYTITASDGTAMVYKREGGQAFAPGSGSASAIQLEGLGDNSMRISMGNFKCISAQWGGTFNWAGVLYVCAVGSGKVVRGLAPLKQHWLFVPVNNGVATTVNRQQANAKLPKDATVKKVPKKTTSTKRCKKTASWIKRHPGYVKSAKHSHPECAHLLKRDRLSEGDFDLALEKRDFDIEERDMDLVKRASGQFWIIAVDHLNDMETRALTKGVIKTGDGGDVASWELAEWNQNDKDQVFTVSSA